MTGSCATGVWRRDTPVFTDDNFGGSDIINDTIRLDYRIELLFKYSRLDPCLKCDKDTEEHPHYTGSTVHRANLGPRVPQSQTVGWKAHRCADAVPDRHTVVASGAVAVWVV